VTGDDAAAWSAQARETAERAFAGLEREPERIPADLRDAVDHLLARRAEILARLVVPAPAGDLMKTRYHGDFHLGQVLVVADDFMIVDFEGEPGRDVTTRRRKSSPLRDVAGRLRSLSYARVAAVRGTNDDRAADTRETELAARDWERRSRAAFLEGYRTTIAGVSSYPADPAVADALLELFVLEKAFYELSYELANRPAWLRIPLEGIRVILDSDRESVALAQ
jgi:maltose alpha-D-glucosyltransferase/alpha-amylase